MSDFLIGTGVALVTPFHADNSVDYPALGRLIEHQITNGVDYLVILGTTGETASIADEDRFQILDFVVEKNAQRVPLVAGFGGNDTLHVIESMKRYKNLDAYQAILSVCPYYNKPNQEGLFLHYKAIAENCPLPIILYNVPGRTGCNMEAATTLRLAAEFENIVAIKEASANFDQIMQICHDREKGFLVISGDDALTLPMMGFGIDGLISVIANALPKETSDMVRAALNNDFATARKIHFKLLAMMHLIFAEGNPIGIKALMKTLGLCSQNVRMPLAEASSALQSKIEKEAENFVPNPVST